MSTQPLSLLIQTPGSAEHALALTSSTCGVGRAGEVLLAVLLFTISAPFPLPPCKFLHYSLFLVFLTPHTPSLTRFWLSQPLFSCLCILPSCSSPHLLHHFHLTASIPLFAFTILTSSPSSSLSSFPLGVRKSVSDALRETVTLPPSKMTHLLKMM